MNGHPDDGATKGISPGHPQAERAFSVLLVGNYVKDQQWSMLRFADLLNEALGSRGVVVRLIQPPCVLGRLCVRGSKAAKWAAYVDKFLLFPLVLALVSKRYEVAHICDHSNAVYRPFLRSRVTVATCHDLLAVRGALGEETFCPASGLGRRLQSAILRDLALIPWVACDSDATRSDFTRLTGRGAGAGLRTLYLGFPLKFSPADQTLVSQALASLGLRPGGFLLQTGSAQARKNREGTLRVLAALKDRWPGHVVFAGEALTLGQRELAQNLQISDRVVELTEVSDELLTILYTGAHALLFPSLCEGFGWPVLEAQACGCPVITADNTSLQEVGGAGAMIFEASNHEGMAQAVLRLEDAVQREKLRARGFENLHRFSLDAMVAGYVNLYEEALASA